MSKIKKISIITIILYMLFITTTFAKTATVTVSAARLREAANTTSTVLTNIYEGEKVEILEKNGEWYKVKYKSDIGYLKDNLIKEDLTNDDETTNIQKENNVTNAENVESANSDSSKIVTNSQTNIRYQPNMMSNVIIQIEAGKELTKIVEIGNWFQISDGTVTGWILKKKVNQNSIETEGNTVKPEESDSKKIETVENNSTNENKSTNTNINKSDKENKDDKENKNNDKVSNETQTEEKNNQSQVTNINKKGKVNVETAKIRSKADKSSKILGFLDYNDQITITAEEGEWYKFTHKDSAGYVHKSLITIIGEENISSRGTNEDRTSESTAEKDTTTVDDNTNQVVSEVLSNSQISTKNGDAVVEVAKQYLGYKYVVGGKNPESGFDCSGFTRYVFLQFGYSLGATAASQNNLGTEVTRDELKPGDLILFYDEAKNKIGHTGIYISGGEFIHSANPKRGVVIDNINTNSYYNERYIVAKRIVQ